MRDEVGFPFCPISMGRHLLDFFLHISRSESVFVLMLLLDHTTQSSVSPRPSLIHYEDRMNLALNFCILSIGLPHFSNASQPPRLCYIE